MRRPGSQDLIFTSNSAEETADLAAALGLVAEPGDFLAFFGDLGVGKTVFAKGFCAALGIDPMGVDSPTFVLLNEYQGRLPVYHFDAYRLEGGREELTELGYFDETLEEGVVIMEWAERVGVHLPPAALHLRIEILDADRRRITIEEPSERVTRALADFHP
ncbi:tRNA (adenosine(37)-N6)-threonylcarbamoyltransferase complex ATPase subunit type 1 TsaE [bacterium]|nr:tRNA (adenosine(37)-N6)-threonylcarbamoyltransferase complex ATPase subunit type 1 TsaE [bacterium]